MPNRDARRFKVLKTSYVLILDIVLSGSIYRHMLCISTIVIRRKVKSVLRLLDTRGIDDVRNEKNKGPKFLRAIFYTEKCLCERTHF